MVDTNNAHVRKPRGDSKRESASVEANEAKRLLNDPAYVRGFDNVRKYLIHEIEHLQHDGSEELDNYERELCRTLRTLTSTKRMMALGVQGQQLREAGFKPVSSDDETKKG